MTNQMKANGALVLITMFWGASCLLTKVGLEGMGEFNLIALRFLIAFVLTYGVFRKQIDLKDKSLLLKSAGLGLVLFLVFLLMSFGVSHTTASNAGFLTCLAGVFIPLINRMVYKDPIKPTVYISVAMAFAGTALLTLSTAVSVNSGDLLCVLCSVAFAFHIIFTNHMTKDVDPLSLSVAQLGFVGLYSLIATFMLETPHLPNSLNGWLIVLVLSVFCSAAAFVIQTVAQKYTTSVYTGLIYSLEPVFAAAFAFVFLGEVLGIKGYVGAVLLLISILFVELDWSKRLKKSPPSRVDA